MEEPPDSESQDESQDDPVLQAVPVFPLPNLWLAPMTLLPLHVFEPRYRQMIEDLLDGPGRLVLGTVREGQDEETTPEVYPIAGLGEIGRHEKLDDGRFMVWIMGLRRVRIVEVPSDRLYRMVEAEPVFDIDPTEADKKALTTSLRRAFEELVDEMPEEQRPPEQLVKTLTVGSLADILCSRLDLNRDRRQEIFATLNTATRARMVLGELAQIKLSDGNGEQEGTEDSPPD